MTILTSNRYTPAEIKQLKEFFEVYIKTVIDVDRKICVAGMGGGLNMPSILVQNYALKFLKS